MGKFDKSRRVGSFAQVELTRPLNLKGGEPLYFQVTTTDGQFHTVDLRRYRDGDTKSGIVGNESLILDLLPFIKDAIDGVRISPGAVKSWLGRRLPVLFKFVTMLKVDFGVSLKSAADFSNEDGVLLKEFLLRQNMNLRDKGRYFTAIQSILMEARGPNANTLHWPVIEVGRDISVHGDVNPAAVKEIYHACKRILSAAEQNRKSGKQWLEQGIRPEQVPFEPDRPLGLRGSIRNSAWTEPANISVLIRDVMRQRITGESLVDPGIKARLHRHTSPSAQTFCGIKASEAYAANAPTAIEVAASVLIVSMETGWIDAVGGIDLSSKWYSIRRGDDLNNLNKTDSVALHAKRPKTSREITAIGLAGARFRSFQVIRRLLHRSEFLRECLFVRRRSIEKRPPSNQTITEIAEIDFRLRSPWLYFTPMHAGAKAVGIFDASVMSHNLKYIKEMAIIALPERLNKDEDLVNSINAFRWSDARDAFATYLFDKSKGNVFAVKRALDHSDIATTRHYLRQKRMLKERFDTFRNLMRAMVNEVSSGRTLDPTILFLSTHQPNFGPIDREKLASYRTQQGMGCANPTSPSPVIAPNHMEGTYCAVQRCILCRQGVIFTDAYDGLAKRHADLIWLRESSNALRWLTSSLSWELEAIELVRDELFADRLGQFNDISSERVEAIKMGKAFVFDEPELRGLISK